MKQRIRNIFAVILVVLMAAGLLPLSALAADTSDEKAGTATIYSTYTSRKKLTDSFYYTDDWFRKDPNEKTIPWRWSPCS